MMIIVMLQKKRHGLRTLNIGSLIALCELTGMAAYVALAYILYYGEGGHQIPLQSTELTTVDNVGMLLLLHPGMSSVRLSMSATEIILMTGGASVLLTDIIR